MRRAGEDRGGVLVLCVIGVLSLALGPRVARLLAPAGGLLGRPAMVWVAAAVVASTMLLTASRSLLTRRALARRIRVALLPADSFDPDAEAVIRFASALGRTRRPVRGRFQARASAVRVRLDGDQDGRLRYRIELPAHARSALRTAASAYTGVELHEVEPEEAEQDAEAGEEVIVRRIELVLARPSTEPLRHAGLDPDPLVGVADALARLRRDLGEDAVVAIDLLAMSAARRRRIRGRLLRDARRQQPGPAARAELLPGPQARGTGRSPAALFEGRARSRALQEKLGAPEPLFAIQVLIQTRSEVEGRAELHAQALLTAFDLFAGENHFRAVGLRVAALAFLGSDAPWRRGGFDRRMRCGLFAPARRRVVSSSEIAGLLKPPSVRCAAPNVLRSGGIIPPPPPGLPSFDGERDLVPLGRVSTETGDRTVGVALSETFFSYMGGRSRYGKTETAIGQFVHLVRAGHGGFFLDPHEDAIEKIKHYLTAEGVAERVVEINLADHDLGQPGWNLFAAHGRGDDRVQEQVDAVVDAFASALGWDERNTRALNLTTQSAQALTELARRLPPEAAPTIFQIPTLLGNDEWRAAVLPHVSPPTRQFFTDRFPRLSTEAITPVTNLIDRLRVAPAVAALLGSPVADYDVRAAMDTGRIVLACPGSGTARDRLVANLFVFDVLHAAKSRAELDPERRRPFYVFLDEVQTYDGSSSGDLAALLEQTAKYGLRAFLFNQNPERLSPATWNAVTTNRSHLMSTALNARAATLLSREWAGTIAPEVVTNLQRYTYLASVTLDGTARPPFLVHGQPVEELFPESAGREELDALRATIDRTTGRRPVRETIAGLDGHDRRILEALRDRRGHDLRDRGGPQRSERRTASRPLPEKRGTT